MDETQGIHRYQQTDLASTGPEKMIVLLYEAAQRHLQQARVATDRRDLAGRTQKLNAAQTIFMELRNALDHDIGGQLSRNLEALYDFLYRTCMEAVVDHRQRHLENALRVMKPLLDAWRKIPPGAAEKATRDLASEQRQPALTTGPDLANSREDRETAREQAGAKSGAADSPAKGHDGPCQRTSSFCLSA